MMVAYARGEPVFFHRSSWPEVVLTAASDTKTSSTVIRYIPGMTIGLDPGYDAGAFNQNPSFGIYTRLVEDNGVNFAVQCLPDNDYENLVVPIGLNAVAGSQVVFTANVSNLPPGKKVYLEDKLTGQFIRLDEAGSSYSVLLSAASQGVGRFYIHTKTAAIADAAKSLLIPVNASLVANGFSTQVLNVIARDASGNYLSRGGSTVLITKASGSGTISGVTDLGNGTYSATVTSPVEAGSGTFVATLDGLPVKNGTGTQAVSVLTYTAGSASAAMSILTPTHANLVANGTSTQLLTLQARDAQGNNLVSGGGSVLMTRSSGSGEISAVTDNHNGTYTATITAPTITGSGTFIASLDGSPVKNGTDNQTEVTITFSPGSADAGKSTLTPLSASLMGDGTSTQVLTVQALDAFGNPLVTGGATVLISKASGSGTITPVADNNDGTYTATVTAPAETGSGTFIATLDGLPVTSGTSSQTVVTITFTVIIKVSIGSGLWFDAGTWFPYGVPLDINPVLICSGNVVSVDRASAVCGNLMVEPGGELAIRPGTSLTIVGDLSNNGTFVIESDALNSGSLITQGTSSGNITYNRYVTGGDRWHLISAPVKGQSIQDFVVAAENSISNQDNKYGLGQFVENQHDWLLYTNANIGSAGAFQMGKGYEINRSGDGTVSFMGTLEPATSIGVTRSVGGDPGWNLIGNPYTSFLNANSGSGEGHNFLTANQDRLEPSHIGIYYWNSNTFDYEPVNYSSPPDRIAPGQGFFVNAATNSTISFPGTIRTHTSGSYKGNSPVWPEIELNAATTYKNSKTVVRFNAGMKDGLDPGYDCGTFDKEPVLGVYSRLIEDNGINFAIQCLPDDSFQNLIIPIGLNVPGDARIVFKASICNLGSDIRVYLEDRLMHVFAPLDQTDDTYSADVDENSDGTGRFFLVINPANMEVPTETLQSIKIIPLPDEQKIRFLGTVELPARVLVLDLNGRVMLNQMLKEPTDNELALTNITNGMYVVTIQTQTKELTQKMAWIR